ncbi:MAG TPA: hypothetical protein VGM23_04865, partial [Armatimonadota bacterium]
MKHWLVLILLCLIAGAALAQPNGNAPFVLVRDGWSYDRANLKHYDPSKVEEKKKAGVLNNLAGWAEYDFAVPADGWYEL